MHAIEDRQHEPASSPPPHAEAPPPARPAPSSARQAPQGYPREKSVWLAAVLSLMPGLGQVYVGYYQRGFVHAIVVGVLISILSATETGLTPLLGLFLSFFWLYNIVDAGRRASLYNQAASGFTESIELPRDLELPALHGSLWGGLTLIGLGAILLSYTRFGYSLRWTEEWWPVAPILVGVWLVVRAIQER